MPALLVLQVPPEVASIKVIVAPLHTTEGPEMVPAVGLLVTVRDAVEKALLQPVVTV